MIRFESTGDWNDTKSLLRRMKDIKIDNLLHRYGRIGVKLLSEATPVDTGLTANSWTYTIDRNESSISLTFRNTNIVEGYPIAIILQYGHGTGTGGWVEGRDYINPAVQPLFDKLSKEIIRRFT